MIRLQYLQMATPKLHTFLFVIVNEVCPIGGWERDRTRTEISATCTVIQVTVYYFLKFMTMKIAIYKGDVWLHLGVGRGIIHAR